VLAIDLGADLLPALALGAEPPRSLLLRETSAVGSGAFLHPRKRQRVPGGGLFFDQDGSFSFVRDHLVRHRFRL
jgi:hypothetical protein